MSEDVVEHRWQNRALCVGMASAVFFPDSIHDGHHAKRICQECPVRAECLNYALTNNERFGIWGGLSSRQRQRLDAYQQDTASAQDELDAAAV